MQTHKDFARDMGVFLEDQGFGNIDEEDPIEMMTRKLEREKRKKKAKKPMSLMTKEHDQDTNKRDCLKVHKGEVQESQSLQGNLFNYAAVDKTNFYIRIYMPIHLGLEHACPSKQEYL